MNRLHIFIFGVVLLICCTGKVIISNHGTAGINLLFKTEPTGRRGVSGESHSLLALRDRPRQGEERDGDRDGGKENWERNFLKGNEKKNRNLEAGGQGEGKTETGRRLKLK